MLLKGRPVSNPEIKVLKFVARREFWDGRCPPGLATFYVRLLRDGPLQLIIAAPLPWTPAAGLDGAEVEALIGLGLVELWAADKRGTPLIDGPFVTLTPLAAERLGVEIHEEGVVEKPRWVHPGEIPMHVIAGSTHPRPYVGRERQNRRFQGRRSLPIRLYSNGTRLSESSR